MRVEGRHRPEPRQIAVVFGISQIKRNERFSVLLVARERS